MNTPFKAFAAISLITGLSACASSPTMPSPEPYYVHVVVERDLAVRQTPNAGGTQIGLLPAGSDLTVWVEDVGGNWYRLHSRDGNIGYIFGKPFRAAD